MRCVVTGGAGFIGSHLVDRLVLGGNQVSVVDNLCHGKRSNVPKGAKLKKMDIRSSRLAKHFRDFRPQVVFHMAAQMEVRRSVEEPMFDAEVNILGLINVLEASVGAGCARVLFASSGGAVYGEQVSFPATEVDPEKPISPYGVTKRAGEIYLDYYATRGLQCTSMRLANVYGPRQDPHGEAGVVAIFSERMLQGEPVLINGNGRQTRDYVFVEDVVSAFVAAQTENLTGAYNVGTGVETDVNALYDGIAAHTGYTESRTHGPAKEGEQMRSVIGANLLRETTDWEPLTSLESGLKQTVEWFQTQRR